MKFEAVTDGLDKLALSDALLVCRHFWLPDHVTPEQTSEIIQQALGRKVTRATRLIALKPSKHE